MRPVLPIVCLALSLPAGALARPSRWDEARDPRERQIERALTRAIQARASRDLVQEAIPAATALFALRAATVLDLEGGEALARLDARFFFGDALVVANHGQDERGRRLLRDALGRAPESPEAARALRDIAVASGRLSDFEAAREASTDALRLEWDRDARGELLLLRAWASMALGELRAARTDFTTVFETATGTEAHALAEWGLGAALAREGDLPGALRHAREAAAMRFTDPQGNVLTVLELPHVQLVPDYDAFYYRALAAMGASERADAPGEAESELEWALSSFKRYLIAAREVGDRHVANAEQALRSCERRLAGLRARSGGAPGHRGPSSRQ